MPIEDPYLDADPGYLPGAQDSLPFAQSSAFV
jgi:hypothetical protein